MTENAVEKLVVEWMQKRGWRATRNHVGVFTRIGGRQGPSGGRAGMRIAIGTPGFPDWSFTRGDCGTPCGHADLFHWEAKATGKKPEPKQFEVMASLNHLGELAIWSDSLESFVVIYRQYFPHDT